MEEEVLSKVTAWANKRLGEVESKISRQELWVSERFYKDLIAERNVLQDLLSIIKEENPPKFPLISDGPAALGEEPAGKERPVSDGFEEEMKYYGCKVWNGDPEDLARHFAAWQREKDARDMILAQDEGFRLGKATMRLHLMTKACEWLRENAASFVALADAEHPAIGDTGAAYGTESLLYYFKREMED